MCSAIYYSYDKIHECDALDVVHNATPHYPHCEIAIKALENDTNVFIEKQMCIKEEKFAKLIKAERKSKACACILLRNRFCRTTQYARKQGEGYHNDKTSRLTRESALLFLWKTAKKRSNTNPTARLKT